MSKRRKRMKQGTSAPPPTSTGIAGLLSEIAVASLDLHGLTAAQAQRRLQDFITTHGNASAGQVVHVITGKGSGSEGPAVLWELVRGMLADQFLIQGMLESGEDGSDFFRLTEVGYGVGNGVVITEPQ